MTGRAVLSYNSFEYSVKIQSDTVISRVMKSKYNVIFLYRKQITTGVPYRMFEKITKIIAKLIFRTPVQTILNIMIHAEGGTLLYDGLGLN